MGIAADLEKDFWLAFDLLRNPKDHVEFSIVRDWLKETLLVRPFLRARLAPPSCARNLCCIALH